MTLTSSWGAQSLSALHKTPRPLRPPGSPGVTAFDIATRETRVHEPLTRPRVWAPPPSHGVWPYTTGNEAGECYVKLSECHLKLDSKHEAASALVDAANAYKKTNKKGARDSTATWGPREDAGQKRSPASRLAPPSTVDCYLIAHAVVCVQSPPTA